MSQSLQGLAEIVADYDLFLFDQWGVVHDGQTLYPHFQDTIEQLRATPNKTLLVLSNSSKRAIFSKQLMGDMGLSENLWDEIITSGEHCLQCLRERPTGFYSNLGRKYYGIHWPEGYDLPDGLDYQAVSDIATADFILLTGLGQSIAAYQPILQQARERDLPLVCANPDLRAPEGGVIKDCPGLVLEQYRNMGGTISSHGKPAKELYDLILQKYPHDPKRVLAIGDSMHHDIQGANNAGISSLLLTQGIHRDDWNALLAQGHDIDSASAELSAHFGAKFDYVMAGLRW